LERLSPLECVSALEAKLEVAFASSALGLAAVTHKSYSNEHREISAADNERLEFLGDAVVDLAISHRLMERFPSATEGELSKLRALIVNEEGLARIARQIGLGDLLLLGRGEELTGGRQKNSVLADGLEAVLGAALEADGSTNSGATDFGDRLVLVHGWNTATLLVKNGHFTGDEIGVLRRFAAERQFDLDWYPGIKGDEANRYHRLVKPTLNDVAFALLGPGRSTFLSGYSFNVWPATDDQPFFFRFFKWSLLPQLAALRGQGGFVFVDAGYLVVVLALLQAIIASAILILLPLAWIQHGEARRAEPGRVRVAFYFLLIGLAFLSVEIAFIHRFSLFLGHPLAAISVTLASFLVSAGLGSGISKHVAARWPEAAVILAVASIVGLGAIYAIVLPPLFGVLMGLPLPVKIAVVISLLAPLGFVMGLPFPLGLARVSGSAPHLIPWAWGINGCASVVAAVMASLLAMHIGFTALLALALGLYTVTPLLLGRSRPAA